MDPAADARYIKELREHLDSVRRAENRPTVALVLSGGGAKGAAQVGVLKYLEEIGMPVDMVCGTSIGGLIGGLYSLGYNADDIHVLFRTRDWGMTLTDRVEPRYIPYATKIYRQKYLVSVPFHYVSEDLHLGADDADLETRAGVGKLTSSLPSGYAYGFNINNLLASLSVGYHDSLSFRKLPLPYMCVAADMVSMKAKNWGSGQLKTAMRSTMSIPALFEPVRTQGLVLVDGGTRNNFPTDFAKAAGADYIIGVELSDASPNYDQVNLGSMFSQFIKMLGKDAFDKNVDKADVKVKPELGGFNMLSFNPAAVDTIFNRGYAAALGQKDYLLSVRDAVGRSDAVRTTRKAVNLSETPVQVGSIEFEGLSDRESRMLMKKIGLKAGQMVDKNTMDAAMSKLQATGAFESVTYSLLGTQSPFNLKFHCVKGPVHEVGFGFRIDSEEWAVVGLHLGINTHKLMGSKFELEGRLSRTQMVSAKYSLDLPGLPTINAKARFNNVNSDLVTEGLAKYAMNYITHDESVYLSNIKLANLNFNVGVRNRYYTLTESTIYGSLIWKSAPDKARAYYMGGYLDGTLYTLDDKYFPRRGLEVTLRADADYGRNGAPIKPLRSVSADMRLVIPAGRKFALVPDLHYRSVFNNEELMSPAHTNYIGGPMAGRYFDQQIPFCGFGDVMEMGDHVFVANLEARLNPVKDLYLSLTGGYASGENSFEALISGASINYLGASFGVGYDSIAGPIRFDVRWSDNRKWGVYLSLGFDI